MKAPAIVIGIGKPKGGPPPPPPGMKDIPGQMGMSEDKPDDAPLEEEAVDAEPKTAEEILAAICDMCRKYEESKDEPDADEMGGASDDDADNSDDSGYGPQA